MPIRLAGFMRRHGRGAGILHNGVHHHEVLARAHRLLCNNAYLLHDAIRWSVDLRLQLHGREENKYIAPLHLSTFRSNNLDDRRLDRSVHHHLLPARRAARSGRLRRRRRWRGGGGGAEGGAVAGHEGEEDLVVHELRMHQDVPVQALVRVHPLDVVALERCQRALPAGLECHVAVAGGEADELAHERVVVHARPAALEEGRVHAHALAAGLSVPRDLSPATRRQ
mmetsp:Transcript_61313/g.159248  ORF Transcript_61313/g.159248 Transcript_61313/m.159248 type:complete len:225 (+) Transcript_61313:1581-2255(+)